jgi:predicted transcriptional regulator
MLGNDAFYAVAVQRDFPYSKAMEVHIAPELQAKLDKLVVETGCTPDKLIEDALAGYFAELAQTRDMLDSRYDDLKTGRVKPIPGDEVEAYFREKSAFARRLRDAR